jgi:hypothetical protein
MAEKSFMNARNRSAGQNGETPRKQACFSSSHTHFCENTAKRFRVHLLSFLSEHCLPLEQDCVEAVCENFQNEFKQLHLSAYLSKLFVLRRQVSKRPDQSATENGVVQAANLITSDFSRKAGQLFGASIGKYLEKTRQKADSGLTSSGIEAFRTEFLKRAARQTKNILELFGLEHRTHPSAARPSVKQSSAARKNGVYVIPYLQDIFGRGLLYPTELYPGITDADGGGTAQGTADAAALPRKICFHILSGIRKQLVGAERYDRINAQLLKQLMRATGKDCGFNVRECAALLMKEQTRRQLMEHMARCLELLTHRSQRERLIQNINASIRKDDDAEAPTFCKEDLTTLCTAWARFLYDNYALVRSKRTTKILLERYLPEKAGALRKSSTTAGN